MSITLTYSGDCPVARRRMVMHLRLLAANIEQGASIVAGGIYIQPYPDGTVQMTSDIAIEMPVEVTGRGS